MYGERKSASRCPVPQQVAARQPMESWVFFGLPVNTVVGLHQELPVHRSNSLAKARTHSQRSSSGLTRRTERWSNRFTHSVRCNERLRRFRRICSVSSVTTCAREEELCCLIEDLPNLRLAKEGRRMLHST